MMTEQRQIPESSRADDKKEVTLLQGRLSQKEKSEQQLVEDARRQVWEDLLQDPRRPAALFKHHIDCLLEEYHTRLDNLHQQQVETLVEVSRQGATDESREDTSRSTSEEPEQEIQPAAPSRSQNLEGESSSSSKSKPSFPEDQQPLLPRSDKTRTPSLQEKLQELFKDESKRKELEPRLLAEAAKIEKKKRYQLEKWKVPQSVEAEVHLRYLLQVLDKKELGDVYERRIKDDKELIEHRESRGTAEDDIDYVDTELGRPKLPDSYTEIKRLLDIENHPVYVKALQEWSRKEGLFSNRVERKKQIVSNLKNEVYQLIGFFSVFQGVVLTAVCQSNFLRCHNLWSPICLSALASVASISGVVQKLVDIKAFQTTIDSEEKTLKTVVASGQRLRLLGTEDFSFATSVQDTTHKTRKGIIPFGVYHFLVTATLLAFGVLFPVSYWRILCYADAPAPAPSR